jgi:hypothetical protein
MLVVTTWFGFFRLDSEDGAVTVQRAASRLRTQ